MSGADEEMFCKPDVLKQDVLKPDVLKPDVLKPDVLWVYQSEGSGRSAFMGGVSPVLYRLVVSARPVKIHAGVLISGGRANFHHFL